MCTVADTVPVDNGHTSRHTWQVYTLQVVKGIVAGCQESDCILMGGEVSCLSKLAGAAARQISRHTSRHLLPS